MNRFYLRQDGVTPLGPYEAGEIKAWLAGGQVRSETECSRDGVAWARVGEVGELAGAAARPAGNASSESSLLIRQGANIQGPYLMSRIRGYVAQRRVQPYMLFSSDGIYWVGMEHVPGLIPAGYVPVPPAKRESVVPNAVPAGGVAAPPPPAVETPAPAPGPDVGSTTLTGYRLEESEMEPPSSPPPLPARPARPPASARPPDFYVRTDSRETFGPCDESVIRRWIAEGRIGPDTEFSIDGRHWVLGAQMTEFFPPATPYRVPGSRSSGGPIDDPERKAAKRSWRFRDRK